MALRNLIDIARKWSKLTYKDGDGHKDYCGEWVSCYHNYADGHSRTQFGVFPHTVDVAFHTTPRISMTEVSYKELPIIIAKAEKLFEERWEYLLTKDATELEKEKSDKIKALKAQLEILESPTTPQENA